VAWLGVRILKVRAAGVDETARTARAAHANSAGAAGAPTAGRRASPRSHLMDGAGLESRLRGPVHYIRRSESVSALAGPFHLHHHLLLLLLYFRPVRISVRSIMCIRIWMRILIIELTRGMTGMRSMARRRTRRMTKSVA
jgi:hypothetical protein